MKYSKLTCLKNVCESKLLADGLNHKMNNIIMFWKVKYCIWITGQIDK